MNTSWNNPQRKLTQQQYCEWGFLKPSMNLSFPDIVGLDELEQLILDMPNLIKQLRFRKLVTQLAPLDVEKFSIDCFPRIKLTLGMLAQAFVWCNGEDEKTNYVPESIAIPLAYVAGCLNEPPILNYADYVLRNTQLTKPEIDGASPFKSMYTFTGMESESGFILTHVLYELKGREALQIGLEAIEAMEHHDIEMTKKKLEALHVVILSLIERFNTVYQTTREEDFREHFRIFLKGWKKIIPDMIYRGVSIDAGDLRGETGAQSSLLPFLDSMTGVGQHLIQNDRSYGQWRPYMPELDRVFLSEIDFFGKKLRDFVCMNPTLIIAYNNTLIGLIAFRKNHLITITQYIEGKGHYKSHGIGTGGTFYSAYLGGLIERIESLMV